MNQLNDKWLRIIGIPLMATLGQWLFFDSRGVGMKQSIPIRYGISIVTVSLLWELCRRAIMYVRKRYPEAEQISQRIGMQTLLFLFATISVRFVMSGLVAVVGFKAFPGFLNFLYNVFITLVSIVPIAGIYEGIFFFNRWKKTYVEAQELRKMNLQSQLDSLKAQINPHFLFNNLNSLSSLIQTDPDRAEEFLEELSSVYRYLLQKNHGNICSIREELQFIQAYFHLLKTRFGEGLFWDNQIPASFLDYHIPTLTLQLLVENAVKHNVVSKSKPLTVRMYVADEKLIVENNLQKKIIAVPSNRIGLSSILQKYELMNQPGVEIVQNNEEFRVILPLIQPIFNFEMHENATP